MSHLYDRLIDCGPASDNIMVRRPVNSRPFRGSSLRKSLHAPMPMVFAPRPQRPTTTTTTTSSALQSSPTNKIDNAAWSMNPPFQPLPWVWTCHRCRQSYRLGVTRQCLEDGHLFCTGRTSLTTGKRVHEGETHSGGRRRKKRQEQSCSSSFDYSGWAEWQAWRREVLGKEESREADEKCCWLNCDFPSECRWRPRFQEQEQEKMISGTVSVATQQAEEEEEDMLMSDVEAQSNIDTVVEHTTTTTLATIAEEPEPEPELVPSTDEPGSPEEEFVEPDDDDEDDIVEDAAAAAEEEEEGAENEETVTATATAVFIPPKNSLRISITGHDEETVQIDVNHQQRQNTSSSNGEGEKIPSPVSPLKQHYLLPGILPGVPRRSTF